MSTGLSQKSAEIVRATLPAVAEAIDEVSGLFYRRMFAAHPELGTHLFNRGNQASGTQRQALAGSIAAYATALVTPQGQLPEGMLTRIAHKHASLGIAPQSYEIVHTHLFAALGEVLGDAATDEVVTAWDEVYWLMADTLREAERGLYARAGVAAGEVGATWRPWEVVERVEETGETATFRIRPADGRPAPCFRAGQYVSVRVELADGARQIRQYSLSGAPGDPVHAVTVKRELRPGAPAGEVSQHLLDHVRAGSRLEVSAPYGDLVLRTEDAHTPVLLASAGIGCTPLQAMLHQLVDEGHQGPVISLHADRTPGDHALREERERLLAKLADAHAHTWYTERDGRMDPAAVTLPAGLRAYLCGPLPFMRALRAQLLERGVAADRIHYEVFGPDMWLAG
ncbi:FAD-binding oxidoreductase [Streptomyces tubbatahanensis]|uniref:nitric oxide dioxygenase n=1 Tax=Streptomyces tubbatahanensis TaxID=2923272 RepID=A0ABY3XZ58_9ACTN|nr:globin domain-containing protein [Streptomyces tubbatahanensis]UNS99769.1 FAD-binding oxidoreductase [Streptomyces tubbatahanensis]